MKYILLSAVFLSICGCGWFRKELKTPEEVAMAFSVAAVNLDFEEIAYHCEPETAEMLRGYFEMFDNSSPTVQEESKKMAKLLQSVTCTTTDSIARCQVCCGQYDRNFIVLPSVEQIIVRLQPNGRWLVFIESFGYTRYPGSY